LPMADRLRSPARKTRRLYASSTHRATGAANPIRIATIPIIVPMAIHQCTMISSVRMEMACSMGRLRLEILRPPHSASPIASAV
jgi:hypothetical protein